MSELIKYILFCQHLDFLELKPLNKVRGYLITGIILGIVAFIMTVFGTCCNDDLLGVSLISEIHSGKLSIV